MVICYHIASMKHYLIYVPGLGDAKTTFQELAVKSWRLRGVRSETYAMRWSKGRNFDTKFKGLLDRIDTLMSEGYEVSLVGASAGGSVVMNALAARPGLHSVIGICAVMNTSVKPHPLYYRKNPAFKGSMELLEKSLATLKPAERHRVMSLRALVDPVVSRRSSAIRGALHARTWTMGHFVTIAYVLTFGAGKFVRFAKKNALQYELAHPVK